MPTDSRIFESNYPSALKSSQILQNFVEERDEGVSTLCDGFNFIKSNNPTYPTWWEETFRRAMGTQSRVWPNSRMNDPRRRNPRWPTSPLERWPSPLGHALEFLRTIWLIDNHLGSCTGKSLQAMGPWLRGPTWAVCSRIRALPCLRPYAHVGAHLQPTSIFLYMSHQLNTP